MADSRQLAKLIGPTMIVLTISEMINYHIWDTTIPQVIYLNGIILFVVGISILTNHNLWVRDWPIVITLVGWTCIFFGLFRIFFPEAKQAPENTFTFAIICFFLAIGVFLSFKAYRQETS